ncbi:MAG: 1-acyl-sn-glycerol-3-phosphate acyltransferase [Candidatus Magasanikbacteria bacterium]|nr:1-acyl-sn-glycerol-3-phosphate acyltransferase [Candidatus Magasanikbacteria bacterium]
MIWRVITYLWGFATALLTYVWMYWLNSTTVIGRKNLPRQSNCLLISNHLTLIDSWFIGVACYFPWVFAKPWLIPWHLPEEKNYMDGQPLRLMCQLWRCIPVNRGSGDFWEKLPEINRSLQEGNIIIFPEGTRSRKPKSGVLYRWNKGACVLAHENKATVIPVAIRGIEDILPIGRTWPRFGRRVVIVVGEPIDGLDFLYNHDRKRAIPLISDILQTRLQNTLNIANHVLAKKAPKG